MYFEKDSAQLYFTLLFFLFWTDCTQRSCGKKYLSWQWQCDENCWFWIDKEC